jgi:hypothetical protein
MLLLDTETYNQMQLPEVLYLQIVMKVDDMHNCQSQSYRFLPPIQIGIVVHLITTQNKVFWNLHFEFSVASGRYCSYVPVLSWAN